MTKDPTILERSKKPKELIATARAFAASAEPADQAVLLEHLGSASFLQRLNSDLEYLGLKPHSLEVAAVLQTLMEQTHAAAIQTLVGLTRRDAFQAHPSLVELNIRALASDRPASPRTLAYWDLHSAPDASNILIVMEAIFRNRSEPALRLFETKMNDPQQDEGLKRVWLRDPLLRARNDPQVLAYCERMLTTRSLEARWHNPLLEVLFDYNEKWYVSCKFPRPPERLAATAPARAALGRIGDHALDHMQLFIPGLRAKIEGVLKRIGHDRPPPPARAGG